MDKINETFLETFSEPYSDMSIQHEDDVETFKREREGIFDYIDNEDELESELADLKGSFMTLELDINWNPIEEKTNDDKRALLSAFKLYFNKTDEELKKEFIDAVKLKLSTEAEEGQNIILQRANDYIDELLMLVFNNKFKLGGTKYEY